MDQDNLKDRLSHERLSNAKKTNRKAKAYRELSVDQLEEVTGGFWETEGYSANYWIECPNCQRSRKSDFVTHIARSDYQIDEFECKCGFVFYVDSQGYYYW